MDGFLDRALVVAGRSNQQVEGESTGGPVARFELRPEQTEGGRRAEQREDRVDDVAVVVPLLVEQPRDVAEVGGKVTSVIGADPFEDGLPGVARRGGHDRLDRAVGGCGLGEVRGYWTSDTLPTAPRVSS